MNQIKEANAMFRICTLVRDQLRKELDAGESRETVGQRLKDFYQVTSPKVHEALCKATPTQQAGHLSEVLHCHILVVLDKDEFIDFPKLREFLSKTWPDMNVDEAIKPTAPMFTTISGKEVRGSSEWRTLLEKVEPQPNLKFPEGVDPSDPVRSTLGFYWAAIVTSGVNIDPDWQDFEVFEKWAMETGYKRFHVLRREYDELGYVPGNVSWHEVSRRTRDPQEYDRVEMDDYLKSRGIDPTDAASLTAKLLNR